MFISQSFSRSFLCNWRKAPRSIMLILFISAVYKLLEKPVFASFCDY